MEALQRLHNLGSISTGYDIDNSAAFGGANGIQFNPSSDGNQRTWTMSLWVKRSEIGVETTIFGAQNTAMVFMSPDWFRFHLYTGSTTYYYDTDNTGTVFRDTSAWYHFVFQCDTTQGTAANRTKLYINGALYTGARGGADTSANIPQNTEFRLNNNAVNFNVGYFYAGGEQLDGYLSEVNFTDGVANDADAFGEYDEDSGIWKPKAYAGSYGTNGFYLEFKESAASATGIGKDTSGNGHNFSTGGAYPSQATDTPTNNFCTFNPLQTVRVNTGAGHKWTISNGATSAIQAADYGYMTHAGNIGFKKGKWYAEFKAGTGTVQAGVGMNQLDNTGAWETNYIGAYANATAIGMCKSQDGYFYRNGGSGALGVSWTAGDILGIAIRINDDGTGFMGMSKNGTWENSQDPSSGTSGMLGLYYGNSLPANLFHSFAVFTRRNNGAMLANFGGFPGFTISSANADANGYGSFEYAVPTGYYALCTKNLEEYG